MGSRPSTFKQETSEEPVKPVSTRTWSEQQEAIFNWFQYEPLSRRHEQPEGAKPVHLVVRARAGCIEGKATIAINRAGKGWSLSLHELVEKFNGRPWPCSLPWDLSIPTFVQQARDNVIRLGRLKDAWCSGPKRTYRVTTDQGRHVRATSEHPFFTEQGWSPLGELSIGTLLYVRGQQVKGSFRPKTIYSDESGMGHHPYAVHRPADKTHPNGSARVATHRLVVEAERSGLDFQEFLWRVRCGSIEGLTFLDPEVWAVHHKDRHPNNNTYANLEVLKHKEHHRRHGTEDLMNNVLYSTRFERAVSIEDCGEEWTYDLEVENEPHNFLANGFVVHNTGKTTTICEGINRAPEDSIWACAFAKRNAIDLTAKISNPNVDTSTVHSRGLSLCRRKWRRIPVAEGHERSEQLTKAVNTNLPKQIERLVSMLHTKGRDMLGTEATFDKLVELAYFFDIVPGEDWEHIERPAGPFEPKVDNEGRKIRYVYDVNFVTSVAMEAISHAASIEPDRKIGIDFADMLFLPLTWDLITPDYNLVVVDEAQDWTMAQLSLALKSCNGRICLVGDDKQAIYGFRGADSGSLDRLKAELNAEELPLVTTYRCAQVIVERARKLVPDLQAAPSNPEGTIRHADFSELILGASGGDFVLSRTNAPLVMTTLAFLRQGKRARMAGRDIGAGILSVLKRLRCPPMSRIEDMMAKLDAWEAKTATKFAQVGNTVLADKVRDQAGCLRAIADGCDDVSHLMERCEHLFVSEDNRDDTLVLTSSVHKAKGLEANRVWVLVESLYRRGDSQEERNCEYVAITRAKSELILVTEVPGLARRVQ